MFGSGFYTGVCMLDAARPCEIDPRNVLTRSEAALLPGPDPNVDQLLWKAIEHRRLLRFHYRNKERILEPHDYGVHKGSVKLFGYQVGGASSEKLPNWRWMETDRISDIQILDQTFPGGRPTSSGKHHKWDKLFIRVKPPSEE